MIPCCAQSPRTSQSHPRPSRSSGSARSEAGPRRPGAAPRAAGSDVANPEKLGRAPLGQALHRPPSRPVFVGQGGAGGRPVQHITIEIVRVEVRERRGKGLLDLSSNMHPEDA